MTDFVHLRRLVYGEPWAIQPLRLEAIAEVFHRRCVLGVRMTPEEIADIKGTREPNGVLLRHEDGGFIGGPEAAAPRGSRQNQGQAIAVINMMGVVAQHASQVDNVSGPGGVSTERVSRALDMALADPSIGSIVLNMDSPGGSVYGVQELADQIRSARSQKPIVAQVSGVAGSAMYWLAAQASEIVVQPSGQVGSIGVYALHQDVSKASEQAGVAFTFVSAGKYKAEGNRYQPLDGEAAAAIQQTVDGYYRDFTNAVAKGRGVSADAVRTGFGEGRMVRAADAVKLGMADRVDTLQATLERLATQAKSGRAGSRAEDVLTEPVAEEERPAPNAEDPALPAQAETPAGIAPELHDLRARRHAHRLRGV